MEDFLDLIKYASKQFAPITYFPEYMESCFEVGFSEAKKSSYPISVDGYTQVFLRESGMLHVYYSFKVWRLDETALLDVVNSLNLRYSDMPNLKVTLHVEQRICVHLYCFPPYGGEHAEKTYLQISDTFSSVIEDICEECVKKENGTKDFWDLLKL